MNWMIKYYGVVPRGVRRGATFTATRSALAASGPYSNSDHRQTASPRIEASIIHGDGRLPVQTRIVSGTRTAARSCHQL